MQHEDIRGGPFFSEGLDKQQPPDSESSIHPQLGRRNTPWSRTAGSREMRRKANCTMLTPPGTAQTTLLDSGVQSVVAARRVNAATVVPSVSTCSYAAPSCDRSVLISDSSVSICCRWSSSVACFAAMAWWMDSTPLSSSSSRNRHTSSRFAGSGVASLERHPWTNDRCICQRRCPPSSSGASTLRTIPAATSAFSSLLIRFRTAAELTLRTSATSAVSIQSVAIPQIVLAATRRRRLRVLLPVSHMVPDDEDCARSRRVACRVASTFTITPSTYIGVVPTCSRCPNVCHTAHRERDRAGSVGAEPAQSRNKTPSHQS